MTTNSGPAMVNSGLTFSMDVANPKCINASGCTGYNNAAQLIKNLVSPTDAITASSTLRLGNLSYFTAFGIDYPETSYGGAAAGRNGLTAGFNVTSGTKTYESSRALHLWVWNNDTSSWIADSYFTGYRLSGHCYDTYAGADAPGGYAAELTKFASDYNIIKSTFQNCTYIVMGSHRDSYRNSTTRAIMLDLGMPAGTDLDSDYIGAPEYVLVGKPGTGSGNGAWAYQNYTTDSTYVAHMNIGLPFKGDTNNYLSFDGANDYLALPNTQLTGASAGTVSAVIKIPNAQSEYNCIFSCETGPDWNNLRTWLSMYGANQIRFTVSSGTTSTQNGCVSSALSYNTPYHVTGTYDGTNVKIYINGVLNATYASNIVPGTYTPTLVRIGHHYSTRYFNGSIYALNTYNRALSADEVAQNYNAIKGRYGI